jgi:hypothetical protein
MSDYTDRGFTNPEDKGAPEGNTNAVKHGLYQDDANVPEEIQAWKEERTDTLVQEAPNPDSADRMTAEMIADLESRIYRASQYMNDPENFAHYHLEQESGRATDTMDKMMKRRSDLLKEIGLSDDSPEAKMASDASNWKQVFLESESDDSDD